MRAIYNITYNTETGSAFVRASIKQIANGKYELSPIPKGKPKLTLHGSDIEVVTHTRPFELIFVKSAEGVVLDFPI